MESRFPWFPFQICLWYWWRYLRNDHYIFSVYEEMTSIIWCTLNNLHVVYWNHLFHQLEFSCNYLDSQWMHWFHIWYISFESILIHGCQFLWTREETQVPGFLNLCFWAFSVFTSKEIPFSLESNIVVLPTHENHKNWYPRNNSTFILVEAYVVSDFFAVCMQQAM